MSNLVVPKAWRSELFSIIPLILTGLAAPIGSWYYPKSVIRGPLFSLGDSIVFLDLPLFWLIPCGFGCLVLFRVFNVRYILNTVSIESRLGVLSMKQRIARVRYEDVRSLELYQSVIGRLLDVGDVRVGSSGTSDLEVVFEGVYAPREVQEMIRLERDRRQVLQDPLIKERYKDEIKAVGVL